MPYYHFSYFLSWPPQHHIKDTPLHFTIRKWITCANSSPEIKPGQNTKNPGTDFEIMHWTRYMPKIKAIGLPINPPAMYLSPLISLKSSGEIKLITVLT
jgi:hypothetical protein